MKLLVFIIFFISEVSFGDFVSSRDIYVTANNTSIYAKCIPEGSGENREEGRTLVYRAKPNEDVLLYSFDWYASQTYITRLNTVRVGSAPTGHQASESDLGIAFYHETNMVARYSMLDLAGSKDNVMVWASHYSVIKNIGGFIRVQKKYESAAEYTDPIYCFELLLHDDRKLIFNIKTGKIIELSADMTIRKL